MNHSEGTKDFELSASSIQAGLSHLDLEGMTGEEWEVFIEKVDEKTDGLLELMGAKSLTEAEGYLEKHRADLVGDEDVFIGLACHLADKWEQWCENESNVSWIAEKWLAVELEDY